MVVVAVEEGDLIRLLLLVSNELHILATDSASTLQLSESIA